MSERQKLGLVKRVRGSLVEKCESLIDNLPDRAAALPLIGGWIVERSLKRGELKAKKLLDALSERRERRI